MKTHRIVFSYMIFVARLENSVKLAASEMYTAHTVYFFSIEWTPPGLVRRAPGHSTLHNWVLLQDAAYQPVADGCHGALNAALSR